MTVAAWRVIEVAAVVYGLMLAEAVFSRSHERALRARGAREPAGDVYAMMRIAYPLAFAALLIEGWWRGGAAEGVWWVAGIVMFAGAKLLKYWAIATLGPLWSFRVLVVADTPLVATGPYRFMRHPNYAGVLGEILAVSMMMTAPLTGVAAFGLFAVLLWRRVRTEERALGLRRS